MQRILVVDDVELNRELLREILRDEYVIDTAEDGVEALEKIRQYADDIGAVLLDLQMPRKDGISVMMEMKTNGWMKRIPVLVISGEYAIEVENQCFELGISDFIHKPFESSVVRNRIKNTMELDRKSTRLNSSHIH